MRPSSTRSKVDAGGVGTSGPRAGVSSRDMLPPYDTEEVAEAIAEKARVSGRVPGVVTAMAHLRERKWTVGATFEGREHVRVQIPFSTEDGVVTPAELAEELLARLGIS